MKPKPLTAEMLEKAGACKEQVDTFRKEWPDGAAVTLKNARRGGVMGLNLDWLALNLLPAAACAEYRKVIAAAIVKIIRRHGWKT